MGLLTSLTGIIHLCAKNIRYNSLVIGFDRRYFLIMHRLFIIMNEVVHLQVQKERQGELEEEYRKSKFPFGFRCRIGKGFQGTIKRHGFARQAKSHGTSKAERKPGSIGQAVRLHSKCAMLDTLYCTLFFPSKCNLWRRYILGEANGREWASTKHAMRGPRLSCIVTKIANLSHTRNDTSINL